MLDGELEPEETYSPTISPLAFATVLHISIIKKLKRRTIDTVGAYLYHFYPKDKRKPLYVKFDKLVAEVCGLDPRSSCLFVAYWMLVVPIMAIQVQIL